MFYSLMLCLLLIKGLMLSNVLCIFLLHRTLTRSVSNLFLTFLSKWWSNKWPVPQNVLWTIFTSYVSYERVINFWHSFILCLYESCFYFLKVLFALWWLLLNCPEANRAPPNKLLLTRFHGSKETKKVNGLTL